MILSPELDLPLIHDLAQRNNHPRSDFYKQIIQDYWICLVSRELSLQGRREVLTGKAKFGVFGDGKELVQVAMAKTFNKGDYRAGYYRDQTLMMALGITSVEDFLAQIYSDTQNDPFSGGRQMNAHFATPFIDLDGRWTNHAEQYNISSGVSCTGGQMGRALGLALASKKYKALDLPAEFDKFTKGGSEICFCTIGDASTSEGIFWETLNAAAVLKVPLLIAVWDDGYGISVPVKLQTAKGSISRLLEGFLRDENGDGIDLYTAEGWDYSSLCITFDKAAKKVRDTHLPAVVHVKNLTQPQGHSTSGSHERYKSKERLSWENEWDCNRKFEEWIVGMELLDEEEVLEMKREARSFVREKKKVAWRSFQKKNEIARTELSEIYRKIYASHPDLKQVQVFKKELEELVNPTRSEVLQNANYLRFALKSRHIDSPGPLQDICATLNQNLKEDYSTFLYDQSKFSALKVPNVTPLIDDECPQLNGYQVINAFFDKAFEKYPNLVAFGEDVGHIGDVNQGMAGLQRKYGKERIFDTGIREWSIIGQGLGLAMRGLRPIAEIQYLDYLVYALPIITDDVATLRYRSKNLQQAPLIIRTRGHRLEGIWHTGSPMGLLVNSIRGIYILTPRNMVQAAGMYNTMLQSSDPAIIIECLNGYRLKEKLPHNIGEYTVTLGLPEILESGEHITLVTYGSCVRIAQEAVVMARDFGISVELIDVQTLIPFDLERIILSSLRKTSKIIFLDEDHPGGCTAYMMQNVLEKQNGFKYLDSPPVTITAKNHRTPYGSDGDYYAKPQVDDVLEAIYELFFETKFT